MEKKIEKKQKIEKQEQKHKVNGEMKLFDIDDIVRRATGSLRARRDIQDGIK